MKDAQKFPRCSLKAAHRKQKLLMKTTLIGTLAIGAASAAMIGAASASVIASDDFTYADGALSGQNAGTGWASAWEKRGGTNTDAVTSGVGSATGDNSAVFDNQGVTYRTLSSTVTATGVTWVTVDMAFTAGNGGSSFIAIYLGLGDPPPAGDPTGGGQWSVGEQWGSTNWGVGSGADSTVPVSTDAAALHTLLFKIDHDAGKTDLWVNAADGALGAADSTNNLAPGAFDTVMFRAGGAGGTTRTVAFDNLIIADTLADVHVPEPSSAALLGLGGLALLRRRRRS